MRFLCALEVTVCRKWVRMSDLSLLFVTSLDSPCSIQWCHSHLLPPSLQWGTVDWEPRADKCCPFKTWSRSKYSHPCFTHCQECYVHHVSEVVISVPAAPAWPFCLSLFVSSKAMCWPSAVKNRHFACHWTGLALPNLFTTQCEWS